MKSVHPKGSLIIQENFLAIYYWWGKETGGTTRHTFEKLLHFILLILNDGFHSVGLLLKENDFLCKMDLKECLRMFGL